MPGCTCAAPANGTYLQSVCSYVMCVRNTVHAVVYAGLLWAYVCVWVCVCTHSISMTSKCCANWAPGSSLESHLPSLFKVCERERPKLIKEVLFKGEIDCSNLCHSCVCICVSVCVCVLETGGKRKKTQSKKKVKEVRTIGDKTWKWQEEKKTKN